MKLPSMLIGALEIALNEFLANDPRALERCAKLDGRALSVHINDLDLELYMLAHPGGLQLMSTLEDAPDVRLSAGLKAFAQTLFSADNASITGRGLRIEGDIGLAQEFAAMLQGVDIDIEDWLEPRIGDVPAHMFGQALRGASAFARRAADTLLLDGAEYLREETRDLVHAEEIAEWTEQADRLRADADRLGARIRRLQQRSQ